MRWSSIYSVRARQFVNQSREIRQLVASPQHKNTSSSTMNQLWTDDVEQMGLIVCCRDQMVIYLNLCNWWKYSRLLPIRREKVMGKLFESGKLMKIMWTILVGIVELWHTDLFAMSVQKVANWITNNHWQPQGTTTRALIRRRNKEGINSPIGIIFILLIGLSGFWICSSNLAAAKELGRRCKYYKSRKISRNGV